MIQENSRAFLVQTYWYLVDWTQTTNTIDYGIKAVTENGEQNYVVLERIAECQCQLIC
jgi:predicted helicase